MKAARNALGDALWSLRMWWRPPATVAWGGRPGLDLQLGSRADRARARHLAFAARQRLAMVRLTLTMRDAFTPAIKAAAEATRDLHKALEPLRRVLEAEQVSAHEALRHLAERRGSADPRFPR